MLVLVCVKLQDNGGNTISTVDDFVEIGTLVSSTFERAQSTYNNQWASINPRHEPIPFDLIRVVLQNGETPSQLPNERVAMRCVIYGVARGPARPVSWVTASAASPGAARRLGG